MVWLILVGPMQLGMFPKRSKISWMSPRNVSIRGIEQAVVGNRLGDIGAAIQEYAEAKAMV